MSANAAEYCSLSPREHYRLYGKVPERQLEGLFDASEAIDAAHRGMLEAVNAFPEQGFLSEIVARLQALSESLSESDKKELLLIIQAAEELADEVYQSGEYGRSELNSALGQIPG